MQRRFTNFIALLISSAIVYLLAIPLMRDASAGGPSCASSLKRAYNACYEYAIENDERFPDAGSWMDRIMFQDPLPLKCDLVSEGYGYAFNDRYSAAVIPSSDAKVLVFESTKLGRNEHDSVESMPHPGRHKGGNNLVFADGTAEFRKD